MRSHLCCNFKCLTTAELELKPFRAIRAIPAQAFEKNFLINHSFQEFDYFCIFEREHIMHKLYKKSIRAKANKQKK